MIEEIEEEYVILRDLSGHENMPAFYGIYMLRSAKMTDQLWISMEVIDTHILSDVWLHNYITIDIQDVCEL